jgi:hypothetical protein
MSAGSGMMLVNFLDFQITCPNLKMGRRRGFTVKKTQREN